MLITFTTAPLLPVWSIEQGPGHKDYYSSEKSMHQLKCCFAAMAVSSHQPCLDSSECFSAWSRRLSSLRVVHLLPKSSAGPLSALPVTS